MRHTYAIRIRHQDGSVARFITCTDDAMRFLRVVGLVSCVTYAAARPIRLEGRT
jgi:hypothetical protein